MPITPIDVLVRVSYATVGAQEVPAGSNKGSFVERCQQLTGSAPGSPWCASWLYMVGLVSLGADWPLPNTAGCQVLADFAMRHGVFMPKPERGDVFVIWHEKLGRFGHTGIVIDPVKSTTVSANTTAPGQSGDSREGWTVAAKPWPFTAKDRFIRWIDLPLHV